MFYSLLDQNRKSSNQMLSDELPADWMRSADCLLSCCWCGGRWVMWALIGSASQRSDTRRCRRKRRETLIHQVCQLMDGCRLQVEVTLLYLRHPSQRGHAAVTDLTTDRHLLSTCRTLHVPENSSHIQGEVICSLWFIHRYQFTEWSAASTNTQQYRLQFDI